MAVKFDSIPEHARARGFLNASILTKDGRKVSLGALILREANPKHQKLAEVISGMSDAELTKWLVKRLTVNYRPNVSSEDIEDWEF